MRKELPYFTVEGAFGGSQEWFHGLMMRKGGCGAATACDCCICFDRTLGTRLYPFDPNAVTKADYAAFGEIMKPYLRPRMGGIDRLELFIDGAEAYLRDAGETRLTMTGLEGGCPAEEAAAELVRQIDAGFPVPYLNLLHARPEFSEYEWHWFNLCGYALEEGRLLARAATYGGSQWLDFADLWETGKTPKGGMVLWSLEEDAAAGEKEPGSGGEEEPPPG